MSELFPYPPRGGQLELIEFILESIGEGSLCISAPTGFGKTPVILAALLKRALAEDSRIVWAVKTGGEADRPIEELKVICEARGLRIFGFSYRGKKDMCLLVEDMGIGELSYEESAFLCRQARRRCPYYARLAEHARRLKASRPLVFSELIEECRRLGVCPYYAQQLLLKKATVISLSYNYVLSREIGWALRRAAPFKGCYLVVDEAHNIQQASSSINSDSITSRTIARASRELALAGESYSWLAEPLSRMQWAIRRLPADSVFKPSDIIEATFRATVDRATEMLEEAKEAGEEVRKVRLQAGARPSSSLRHLADFWLRSLELEGEEGIAFLVEEDGEEVRVERWDMRSAEVLAPLWSEFKACVFTSGTLGPVSAFAETAGLDSYRYARAGLPYDLSRVKAIVVRELSTRGEKLSAEMASRYRQAIRLFLEGFKASVAVYFSSYRVMGELADGIAEDAEALGRKAFIERQEMRGHEAREMLEEFRRYARSGAGVLCATMTGKFAEGVDFPGRQLEGAFLVGIPFDRVTTRTRVYLQYYVSRYGREKGVYYGYVVPALRRVAQAMGRVLRSSDDRALFILGDERYAKPMYFELLPEYAKSTAEDVSYTRIKRAAEVFDEATS